MDDLSEMHPDAAAAADVNGGTDHFIVEDLLDFSNDQDDEDEEDAAADPAPAASSSPAALDTATDSSTLTAVDSNSSSFSAPFSDPNFSNDLCLPYDDLAELEWLSNIVEESFSNEDLQKLHLISGIKARPPTGCSDTRHFLPDPITTVAPAGNNPIFNADVSVPAKARSKRSRAAACNWASRLLLLSPSSSSSSSSDQPNPPPLHHQQLLLPAAEVLHNQHQQYPPPAAMMNPAPGKKSVKVMAPKKREGANSGGGGGEGRKCLHCATDKTPQWRTGPMGPKTLCNACGVRYKSGRLVPEYRPAASPTFVLTKHSNSHRKVMELRKQKEMSRGPHHNHLTATATAMQHQHQHQQQQQFLHAHHHHHPHHHHHHQHHHQSMVFDVTSNSDDYLIHQHVGPDFRQLI